MNDLEIYDTTLRDGTQGEGVNVGLVDKLALAQILDQLGVAFIEGGWPGSNPKDEAFFREVAALDLHTARIAAFGSTRRAKLAPDQDPNLAKLVASGADVCTIFGKSWDLHVTQALRVELDTNLAMIADSIAFLAAQTGKPVFFDAEHFFDGWKANPAYALDSLQAAHEAGAARLVLCDTNGGSLMHEVEEAIAAARARLPEAVFGIHGHNDGGLAVANSISAVRAGCRQVQGTINGIGERCGNADLVAIIANCELKLGLRCLDGERLCRLTEISREVWERVNMVGPGNQPYTGRSAFAHKAGIHVSAMERDRRTYEHVEPESVGNSRRILISELSGRSNVITKLANRYPQLTEKAVQDAVLAEIMACENEGYSFEAADGSFDLLVRRHVGEWRPAFDLIYYRVHGIGTAGDHTDLVEATVKCAVKGAERLCVAEGHGPVDALSHALRQAVEPAFPLLSAMHLVDYKVRVVNSADGTAARVRVLIEHALHTRRFGTVGVSENIIEASWKALVEAVDYAVLSDEDGA